MKIVILQLAPKLGQLEANIARADELLENLEPGSVDILVLPELALTGYNFSSLKAIHPYLEPTAAGPSARWAATTAHRLQCAVVIGYPETTQDPGYIPNAVDVLSDRNATLNGNIRNVTSNLRDRNAETTYPRYKNYNASMTVGPDGSVLANYRKTHLYYTDATWALPSPTRFEMVELELGGSIDLGVDTSVPARGMTDRANNLRNEGKEASSGNTLFAESPSHTSDYESRTKAFHGLQPMSKISATFAVCMDINPEAFTAPWEAYELASHVIRSKSSLLLGTMAWSTNMPLSSLLSHADEPDWETFSHWLRRLRPLIDAEGERLVVLADRAGVEPGGTKVCDLESAGRAEIWEGWVEDLTARQRRDGSISASSAEKIERDDLRLKEMVETKSLPGVKPVIETKQRTSNEGELVGTEALYAGTSVVMALGNGQIKVWAIMGRAQEGLLRADTLDPPESVWVLRPVDVDENGD